MTPETAVPDTLARIDEHFAALRALDERLQRLAAKLPPATTKGAPCPSTRSPASTGSAG